MNEPSAEVEAQVKPFPVAKDAPHTGPVEGTNATIEGEAPGPMPASRDTYPGNPLEPSPKLLGMIADTVNNRALAEATEEGTAIVRWAKALREQFPHV